MFEKHDGMMLKNYAKFWSLLMTVLLCLISQNEWRRWEQLADLGSPRNGCK